MQENELHIPSHLAEAEGWNPGYQDCPIFHRADPGCFLVAECRERPVGVISAARVSPGRGFIGFFVVAPEYRGSGYGYSLWRAGMARLEGCLVGLDSVVERETGYGREGFVIAHRMVRYGGRIAGRRGPARPEVRAAGAVPFAELASYDAACWGGLRPEFLQSWITAPETCARVWVQEGRVRGFGVARRCRTGVRIGPWFADQEDGAEALLQALAEFQPGADLCIDVPAPNNAGRELLGRRGLRPLMEGARMYRGAMPEAPLDRVFGVTSCAIG